MTLAADGPTLELLAEAASPLVSNPQRGEYGAALADAEATDGACMRALAITPPGAEGSAEHYHPNYAESFGVVEGGFAFGVKGDPRTLRPGESASISASAACRRV